MRIKVKALSTALLFLIVPLAAGAQVDGFGAVDTLYVETSQVDSLNWSVNVSYFNDQSVVGLSVPLRLTAGQVRIVADSCIYTGGRVEHFNIRAFRVDTAIQCVTLGMIASLSADGRKLMPGKGRLATIFVSSIDKKPLEFLSVDTTTTHPNNSLEVIADSVQGQPPDSSKIYAMAERKIVPVFKVINDE
jgi:hypothetical protein